MVRLVTRLIVASVVGYALIAVLQTLFLEVLLGGRVEHGAAPLVQAAGLAGTVISGLVGGYLAACLGGRRPLRHAAAVLVPLAADTVFVLTSEGTTGPLWFHLAGSLTLMAATVVGGGLRARTRDGSPGPSSGATAGT